MKSFSILAGLIGLASASWNETWTHSPSSSDVHSSPSVSEHPSNTWVKPTGWSESSSVATSSAEHNATSTLVTYLDRKSVV